MKPTYYNEIDQFAAQMLRNLIAAGHIAPGDVDERSIEDVHPSDLKPYTQCHFFAGVGVWSYALRCASWPDDRPVWTGSCPCQPFSSASQGAGFDDERHLWLALFHLIEQRRPATVFGEQVASRDANPWIDLVQDDLEGLGYRVGAVPFPSAGVGAPHIRDRLYWVGDASGARLEGHTGDGRPARRKGSRGPTASASIFGGMVDTIGIGCIKRGTGKSAQERDGPARDGGNATRTPTTGPVNGLWAAADWLLCRDEKWQPVEPGTFPLAHGAPARVGRLRAYGNAINAEAAHVLIDAAMSSMP